VNSAIANNQIPQDTTTSSKIIIALYGHTVLDIASERNDNLRTKLIEMQPPQVQGRNAQQLAAFIIQEYDTGRIPQDNVMQQKAIRNYQTANSIIADFASKRCYICGGLITTSTPELEHICPVGEALAILNIIQQGVREFLNTIRNTPNFLWSDDAYAAMLEYRDSHLCCNRKKSSTSFIKQVNGNFIMDDVGIKSFLGDLWDDVAGENGDFRSRTATHNNQNGCANDELRAWFKSFGSREKFINQRYQDNGNPSENPNVRRLPGISHYLNPILQYANFLNIQYGYKLANLFRIARQAEESNVEKLFGYLAESSSPEAAEKYRLAALSREKAAAAAAAAAAALPQISGIDCMSMLQPLWTKMATMGDKKTFENTRRTALNTIFKMYQLGVGIDIFDKLYSVEGDTLGGRTGSRITTSTGVFLDPNKITIALDNRFEIFKLSFVNACLDTPGYWSSYPQYLMSSSGYDRDFIIRECNKNHYMFGFDYITKILAIENFQIGSEDVQSTLTLLKDLTTNVNIFSNVYLYLYILESIGVSGTNYAELSISITNSLNDKIISGIYAPYFTDFIGKHQKYLSKRNFINVNFTIEPSTRDSIYSNNSVDIGPLCNYGDLIATYPAMLSQANLLFEFFSSPTLIQSPESQASSAFGTPFGSEPNSQQSSQDSFFTAPGSPGSQGSQGSQGSSSSNQSSNFDQSGMYSPFQQGNRFAALGNSPSSSEGSTPEDYIMKEGGKRRKKRYTRKIIKKYTKKIHNKNKRINKFRRTKKRKY